MSGDVRQKNRSSSSVISACRMVRVRGFHSSEVGQEGEGALGAAEFDYYPAKAAPSLWRPQ